LDGVFPLAKDKKHRRGNFTHFFHNSIFEISLIFEKSINRTLVKRRERQGRKPAEDVEPEPTGNGEPRENPGEKPGKSADNLRGRTKGDIDCGKKILT